MRNDVIKERNECRTNVMVKGGDVSKDESRKTAMYKIY